MTDVQNVISAPGYQLLKLFKDFLHLGFRMLQSSIGHLWIIFRIHSKCQLGQRIMALTFFMAIVSLCRQHTYRHMSFPWGQHSRPFLALSTKGLCLFPFYIAHHFSYHYVGWFWARDVTPSQELRPHFFISDCQIFVLAFCVVQFQTENATQSCKLSRHNYIVKWLSDMYINSDCGYGSYPDLHNCW